MQFTDLPLNKEVLSGIENAHFSTCTLPQELVLPISLEKKDVMVQSKTGSGKTAVFLITILERFIGSERKTKALVISPTRELAVQIEKDARVLSKGIDNYKIGCFFGGVGYKKQEDALESNLDLFVGTPGRLIDFAKNKRIDFKKFDIVVLDEADRMFDMGFLQDIQYMFSLLKSPKERQTMLFSATLSTNVRNLAWRYMNEPKEIEVEPEEITVKKIDQRLFHVTREEKFKVLLGIFNKYKPKNCLIFTNTKGKAVEVSNRLNRNGYKTEFLMGDMRQEQRLKTLDRMKRGEIHYLVATDVAARGLQIDNLEMVVNYDIPEDYENYVHRIGRTARAGKSGIAITFADEEYVYGLEPIEEYIQMKIPVYWADEEGLLGILDKSEGFNNRVINKSTNKTANQNKKKAKTNKNNTKKPITNGKPKKQGAPKREDNLVKNRAKEYYSKLEGLSLEERLKYYQKEFSENEAKKDSEPIKKVEVKKSEPKVVLEKKEEKGIKHFFSKLFKKGKDEK